MQIYMKIIEKIKNKFILGMVCGLLVGCVGTGAVFTYMNKNRQMPGNPPTMNGERPQPPTGANGERPEKPENSTTNDSNLETQTQ